MRTNQSTDVPGRHNGTHVDGLRSETRRRSGAPRRLQQALAELESLKRELASSQHRAATQRHTEDSLKATGPEPGMAGPRAQEDARALPWSTWHTIDPTSLEGGGRIPSTGGEPKTWVKSRIAKAHVLYHAGDRLEALYAVRFGSFKTTLLSRNGQDQVVGFHFLGDVVGTDGVASEFHTCQATALEDAEVFRLPLDRVEHLARRDHSFGHDFHRLLSEQSVRAHTLMLVLGSMLAEQRIAFFLLDLSQRYQARGYSSCEYMLRMSRQEIGSYLGLKLETVSRVFSRFQREGLVEIDGRSVALRDRAALERRADGG